MIKTAKTKYGTFEGTSSLAGYALYKGIPYAKPPVGKLRFMPPEEPDCFDGIRKCDTFGAAAPQAPFAMQDDTGHPVKIKEGYPYPPKMSEDCLYLNIYTPAETPEDKLPVMLYIHGGGLQAWYGSCYEYCGDGFCKHGCILVSINYRLNVFGFFACRELAEQSPNGAGGNYGIMDQIQAIKWVRDNIAAFGGDPDNITIFGQSGGARAVQAIACSPLGKGLFKHAAMHSGGGLMTVFGISGREDMEALGAEFMRFCGCENVEELRNMRWEDLEKCNMEFFKNVGFDKSFSVYGDGYVVPKKIEECALAGEMEDVDYLMGSTIDEGYDPDSAKWFDGEMAPAVRLLAREFRKHGLKDAYIYCFDRPQPGDDAGSFHSADNRYVFASLDDTWRPYTEADYELSEQMQSYWANFAKTGNPNGEGLEEWKPFGEEGYTMHLNIDKCVSEIHPKPARMNEREQEILKKVKKELI